MIEIREFRLPPAAPSIVDDSALNTLLLPFGNGALRWPAGNRVLFLRARAGRGLPANASDWVCEQSFRPYADALERAGLHAVASAGEGQFDLVLVLPPRQREESRALLARALRHAVAGGTVVASMLNNEGARSAEADLASLAGNVHTLSKNKCRVFWARGAIAAKIDASRISQVGPARRAASDRRRPFHQPARAVRLGSHRCGLGAAGRVACRRTCAGVAPTWAPDSATWRRKSLRVARRDSLDLYEAEARRAGTGPAEPGRYSIGPAKAAQLGFHWHDVTRGLPARYDFIVSNPPFHQGRADQPELGRAFIASPRPQALKPGGRLWLVANRHLPYEAALAQGFAERAHGEDADGFKVIEAVKADA